MGKWKERAGGRTVECHSDISFIEEGQDFKATISNPREDILTWFGVLGEIQGNFENDCFSGTLKYRKRLVNFKITYGSQNTSIIEVSGTENDVVFISHIKRTLYKATYCIHCEVCEVECPTGALSVIPTVKIDKNKCIHCLKCIEFDGKGCLSASSVCISSGEKTSKMQSVKSGINRYNDGMGLREMWLKKYFTTYETFFDNDNHGLNPRYQIPPFTNWIREAGILNLSDKSISPIGKRMADAFADNAETVWEIIWVNLTENSEIAKWFYSTVPYARNVTKQELELMIQDSYPDLKDRTLKNPLNSLLNTFKESPLGNAVAVPTTVDRKPGVIRKPYNDLSLVATAYSLYRYAEKNCRYSLTVSEFYNPDQTEGIVRQFGIEREDFEAILRSLEQEQNQVLRAELKMGLDNIILREDLTSEDIIKLMLK